MEREFLKKHLMKDDEFKKVFDDNMQLCGVSYEYTIDNLLDDLEMCEVDITLEVEYLDICWLRNNESGVIYNLDEIYMWYKNNCEEDRDEHTRVCSECGKRFASGYVIENGLEYYCSDECLHKNYSDEEWKELYNNGESDSYWTSWV